jgi:type I restriction enzyme, S subunit
MELKVGYKKTEIGVIPVDWEVEIVNNISNVKSGKRLPKGNYLLDTKNKYPYIRVKDMFIGGVSLNEIKYVPENIYPAIKNYRIFKDDIFISVAGTLGIVGKIPIQLDGANLTENANRLTDIKSNREFLLYVFTSDLIQNRIEEERTLGAQPKLALTRIRNFQIPLPPTIKEQTAIATVLSDTDSLIQALEKKIAKKQLIKKGAMQKLLNPKEGWVVKTLGEITHFSNGKAHEQFIENDAQYIVINSKFVSTQGRVFKTSSVNLSPLKKGDVAMVMSDIPNGKALAKCFLVPKDNKYALNQRICSLRAESVDNVFLSLILNRNKYYLSFDSGTGQTNLKRSDVLNCPIPLPPTKQEQTRIAQILSDMDSEIETLEKKLAKYKELKQGLMQVLLTGKIRLV